MKVHELRQLLLQFDQELVVCVYDRVYEDATIPELDTVKAKRIEHPNDSDLDTYYPDKKGKYEIVLIK